MHAAMYLVTVHVPKYVTGEPVTKNIWLVEPNSDTSSNMFKMKHDKICCIEQQHWVLDIERNARDRMFRQTGRIRVENMVSILQRYNWASHYVNVVLVNTCIQLVERISASFDMCYMKNGKMCHTGSFEF